MIRNAEELATNPARRDALRILEAGLAAAAPERVVAKHVKRLKPERPIHVLGFGKASYGMLLGVLKTLSKVEGGIIITNDEAKKGVVDGVEVLVGDHPLPAERTLNATERLLEYSRECIGADDEVIVLISGGGSALLEKPVPPLSIADLAEVTRRLMRAGADIYELNTVRKHLSLVKGGRLASIIKARRITSLIMSDVVGDRIDVIASGPTAPDPTTYHDAIDVLRRHGLWPDGVPVAARSILEMGAKGLLPETPKPGDAVFKRVSNVIVASNITSLKAMAQEAEKLSYKTLILSSMVMGEAREVGRFLAGLAAHTALHGITPYIQRYTRRVALLMGGETTVTVRGNGIGGRNQELALSFLCSIDDRVRGQVLLASMGSDGVDGVSPAAGAIADWETAAKAAASNLDCRDYLDRNDSYTFFAKTGDAIYTGPTGTNVNDFIVLLVYASS